LTYTHFFPNKCLRCHLVEIGRGKDEEEEAEIFVALQWLGQSSGSLSQ
jgi:hypothetical protein